MENKFALVVGNSDYSFCNKLQNPIKDADSMETELKKLGFKVKKAVNLSQVNFNKQIDEFGAVISNYSLNIFYYAGHGLQYNEVNYLIPTDANIVDELQIEAYCINLNRIIQYFEKYSRGVNIVILDACRNNPFLSNKLRSLPSRGLAFITAPDGMLIAYSTSPGKTADDGAGSNGLYTEALMSQIATPDISLIEVFQRVRFIVKEKSSGVQIPWESTSLTQNVYLIGENKQQLNGQLLDIAHHCSVINAKKVFYNTLSSDLMDESTEGGELTFYYDGDRINEVIARHFGEMGQQITEYFFKGSDLCFVNKCLIRYNRPFYYDESLARENNDTDWHDFSKSFFETSRYYFSSREFIAGYDDKGDEIKLTDKNVTGYIKQSEKYIQIFEKKKQGTNRQGYSTGGN
jgi:hypothetical protein